MGADRRATEERGEEVGIGPPESFVYCLRVAGPGGNHQVARMIALISYHNQLLIYSVHFVGVTSVPVLASVIDYWQTATGRTSIARVGAD